MHDVQSPRTDDSAIEQEIQRKGLTAPRITPADIEAVIAEERTRAVSSHVPAPLELLTFCVLVLRNGFTVSGESACASPENFDADVGRKVARANAVNKIWALLGYELKQRLHDAPNLAEAAELLRLWAEDCENNAPIWDKEGNAEQAALTRANAASYRAAIARLKV